MRLFENDKGYMPFGVGIFEFCKLEIDLYTNNFARKMKAIIDFFPKLNLHLKWLPID